jgi:hypothetical protein
MIDTKCKFWGDMRGFLISHMTASKVVEGLYIGDWQDARDALGPSNLVKVTVAKESPFIGDYYFPLVDAEDTSNEAVLMEAIKKVDELLRQKKVVLVHCVSGISRSCAVIVGYLNLMRGLPLEQALSTVEKARPAVNPEPDLMELLRHQRLPG